MWAPAAPSCAPKACRRRDPAQVRVRALYGAISRGTERLVLEGRVPPSEFQRMRAPLHGGRVSVPGQIRLRDRRPGGGGAAAAAGPHRVRAASAPERLHAGGRCGACRCPAQVPPARAVLAANMETALNAVWDGAPGPADRIAVVGGGVVGLLVARLCARMPGTQVTRGRCRGSARGAGAGARRAALRRRRRRRRTAIWSSMRAEPAPASPRRCGSRARRATIVELSWYGAGEVAAPLGEAFHSRRLRLLASQVGEVAPSHRRALDARSQRLAAALELLGRSRARRACSRRRCAFEDLPARLPARFSARRPTRAAR